MVHKDKYDCHNCGATLTYNQLHIKQRDYGGIALKDKYCPYCGCAEVSKFEDRWLLEKFVYPSEYADLKSNGR